MKLLITITLLLIPMVLGASMKQSKYFPNFGPNQCEIPNTQFCDGNYLVTFTCVEKKTLVSKEYKESCANGTGKKLAKGLCVMPETYCCDHEGLVMYTCENSKIRISELYHPHMCKATKANKPVFKQCKFSE